MEWGKVLFIETESIEVVITEEDWCVENENTSAFILFMLFVFNDFVCMNEKYMSDSCIRIEKEFGFWINYWIS